MTTPPPPGFPPPAPRRGRGALVLGGSLAAVAVLVVALLAIAGVGSRTTAGTAQPAAPTGTATGDAGGSVDVDVEVGGCVGLTGTARRATAHPEPCGSDEANYTVVGKAPTAAACVADSDVDYYETSMFGTGESGALCLDVDWKEGDCFRLPAADDPDGDPHRIRCAEATTSDDVQVGTTLRGTTDDSRCAEGGAVYETRKFVVCLGTPRTS